MALAAIATDVLETLNVLLHLAAKRTFNNVSRINNGCDLADFLVR